MKNNNPRVSICIPTYNRADMIKNAIDSALSQTFQDLEVIILDDASTDNTTEIVSFYDDPRLIYIKNITNLGQFGNFNRCIEVSRGEFLHILHSDDYIDSHFTENCVRFYDEHPNIALTFTSVVFMSSDRVKEIYYADTNQIIPAPEGFRKLLRTGCYIPCPSVMTRRNVYSMIGMYSREYPYAGDFYQWLRISRVFDIAYIRDAVVYYREGDHSETHRLTMVSPVGHLDRLKIGMSQIQELKESYQLFTDDFNCFFRMYTIKSLIAAIKWNRVQMSFRPSFFIGIAYSSWSLIRPQSICQTIDKLGCWVLILGIGIIVFFLPLRVIFHKILDLLLHRYYHLIVKDRCSK